LSLLGGRRGTTGAEQLLPPTAAAAGYAVSSSSPSPSEWNGGGEQWQLRQRLDWRRRYSTGSPNTGVFKGVVPGTNRLRIKRLR
jgi:hypothetical protein